MPSLEISINCLCLFVPDEGAKTVHVLMPPTHDGHKHVVRLIHPKSGNEGKGIPMEGWALKLGGAEASAETTLKPRLTSPKGETLANLTPIAGPISRTVIQVPEEHPAGEGTQGEGHEGGRDGGAPGLAHDGGSGAGHDAGHGKLSAWIELRAGYVHKMLSQATWDINEEPVAMSYRVVWVIPEIGDDELEWVRLVKGTRKPPFESLAELEDQTGHRRLSVYHVTKSALPPKEFGSLEPAEVLEHFRSFYDIYGFTPDDKHLPQNPRPFGSKADRVTHFARAARLKLDRAAIDQLVVIAEEMSPSASDGPGGADRARSRRSKTYDCPTGRGNFE